MHLHALTAEIGRQHELELRRRVPREHVRSGDTRPQTTDEPRRRTLRRAAQWIAAQA
jgi:hypothetical protein